MTSLAKVEANRRNAQRSTGPKTSAGKNRSSKNALRHGLTAEIALLPDEALEIFESFESRLRGALNPVGDLEEFLVDRVVQAAWRLRRLGRVEAGLYTWRYFDVERDRTRANDWKARYGDDRSLEEAQASKRRDKPETTLGRGFAEEVAQGDAFSKLSRYETALERSLYRALHEVQRLQAQRDGQPVPVPVVLDVEVSQDSPCGG